MPVRSWRAGGTPNGVGPLPALGVAGAALSYNGSQICIQTVCNRFAAYVVNIRAYAMIFANMTDMSGSQPPSVSSMPGLWV